MDVSSIYHIYSPQFDRPGEAGLEELWWPAPIMGENRRFRHPLFALQLAGFRRASVQIKGIERCDLGVGQRGRLAGGGKSSFSIALIFTTIRNRGPQQRDYIYIYIYIYMYIYIYIYGERDMDVDIDR